jgi:hypothetical protein
MDYFEFELALYSCNTAVICSKMNKKLLKKHFEACLYKKYLCSILTSSLHSHATGLKFFCRAGLEEEADPYLEIGDAQLLQLAHSCLVHEQPGSFEHSIRYKIEQLLSGNG